MAELLILTDAFTRANTAVGGAGTTTGAGNNWTDVAGSQYNIASNKLNAANVNNIFRNWLLRPSSEDCADQRSVLKFTWTAGTFPMMVLLRANRSTFDSYEVQYVDGSHQLQVYKFNGSAQTSALLTSVVNGSGALTVGNQYVIDASVVGTTLLARFYSVGAAITGVTSTGAPDTFTKTAHGLSNGDIVQPSALTGGAGLVVSQNYYVVNATTNTFQLARTSGGAAVDLSSDLTSGTVQKLTQQATCTITDSSFSTGSFGVTHEFGVTADAISTYNESAPASTGYTFVGPSGGIVNAASTAFTVTLTPAGSIPGTDPTTVTPSDGGGGGSFSPASVQLASGQQTVTFTYTPTTSGIKTLSVTNNGGFTNPASISYTASTAAMTIGAISTVSQAPTAISLSATATTGGTGALAYQWYRSTTANFTPAGGNLIAGATSLTLADTGLQPNTLYFYKLVTTDSLNVTGTTVQFPATTRASGLALFGAPVLFGWAVGDSLFAYLPTEANAITGGTASTITALANMLTGIAGSRLVTMLNSAVAGQTTGAWLPASSQYTTAKAAALAACTAAGSTPAQSFVTLMLGTNDAKDSLSVPAATVGSNLAAIVADMVATGWGMIFVHLPPYFVPGSFSNDFSEAATGRLQTFFAQIRSVCDGRQVILGDTQAFAWFSEHPDHQVDGVHGKPQGVQVLARFHLQAMAGYLLPAPKKTLLTTSTLRTPRVPYRAG